MVRNVLLKAAAMILSLGKMVFQWISLLLYLQPRHSREGYGTMNATTIYESETVTRSIARWGSAAAAIMFALAFVTDEKLSWRIASSQAVPIGLIVAMFVFYTLAWTKRFEALGCVLALVSIIAVHVIYMVGFFVTGSRPPNLWFLVIGTPALFHLMAIVLHRYGLNRMKS
jgi:hypothetical protein